jgi:transposase-like protein
MKYHCEHCNKTFTLQDRESPLYTPYCPYCGRKDGVEVSD